MLFSETLPRARCVCPRLVLAARRSPPSSLSRRVRPKSRPRPTTCCDQPKIPAGIPAFTVVRDEVTGPTDGQDVKMHVALKQKTKRDDIYPALQFLYRYAMTRNTFEPTTFLGAFYATEGDAQTGGNPIAKIWREHGDKGPKCENAIPLEFPEEVGKAFEHSLGRDQPEDLEDTCHLNEKKKIARVDDNFKHKPTMKVDDAEQVRRGDLPVPRERQGRVRAVADVQQRDDLLGRVPDRHVRRRRPSCGRSRTTASSTISRS